MKKILIALTAIGALAVTAGASVYVASSAKAETSVAEARTQTFAIKNMTCALCPVTVKKAMSGVKGVASVDVDFDAKTATVVYDPSIASADEIATASTNAGYPANAI